MTLFLFKLLLFVVLFSMYLKHKKKVSEFFTWIGRVFRGAWYSITDNKATRNMAKERLSHCYGDFLMTTGDWYEAREKLAKIEHVKPSCEHRTGSTCGLCGCVLKFKTRLTEEECPAQKW